MGLIWLGAFSISIGMGAISGGAGGVYPPIRNVGLPLVCEGDVERTSSPFSYKPGQSGISRTTYCVDTATGKRTEITLRLVFAAGLVYSAAVFAALLASAMFLWRRWTRGSASP